MRLGGPTIAAVVLAGASIAAAAPAGATETFFQLDLRAGGFYGAAPSRPVSSGAGGAGSVMPPTPYDQAAAFMGGLHLGGISWFGAQPIAGLLYEGGVEVGPEFPEQGKMTGAVGLSASIGPAFLLSGQPKDGPMISLGWAPRLMLNFQKGEIASPFGAELAITAAFLKFPLWFLRTLDASTFFGFGVGVDFMR